MLKNVTIQLIALILIVLAPYVCAQDNTIEYKYKGCSLIYNRIDEYNVEVGQQNLSLRKEQIYIPSEISQNDTTYYVIGIGDNAFNGNCSIKKVFFDNASDMKYIGEGAFSGCRNLTEIELPSTITEIKPYTFAWSGIKYIETHNFITKIGDRAFTNCSDLKKIDMSENIEEIGNFAFAWCNKLTSFTIPEKTKKLGYEILQANRDLDTLYYNAINCEVSGAYYDRRIERTVGAFEGNKGLSEIIFGYKVQYIPEYLLYNCSSIDTIYFPKSIKKVGRFALHNTEWFFANEDDLIYINNIAYYYKGEKQHIDISTFKEGTISIGDYCFYNNDIKSINIPSTVQFIGKSAFENCTSLTKITLPTDLETIDDLAFKGCENLEFVSFNSSLINIGSYSFGGCVKLQVTQMPNSVKKIGKGAFYNCTNLITLNIPEATKKIPAGCFSNCKNLKKIDIHNDITKIEEYAFAGCESLDSVRIPWYCTHIGTRAFTHCKNLKTIKINARTVEIAPLAFYKCGNITEINLLSANYIGYKAFSHCYNIKDVLLGEGIKIIDTRAFEHCENIKSLYIPKNVTKIGTAAFEKCKNLLSINIDNASVEINDKAFAQCELLSEIKLGNKILKIGKYAFYKCNKIETFSILNPIENIEEACFYKCKNLKSINIPNGVKNIQNKAFADCPNITTITLPNTIETIGEMAFAKCSSLKNIELPNQIKEIANKAFYQCEELTTITIPSSLKKIGKSTFGKCDKLTSIQFNAEKCKAGEAAFSFTTHPTKLSIGKTVIIIDDHIFENMNIEYIIIPNNVSKIGKSAFANSLPLTEIELNTSGGIDIDNSAFNNTTWYNKQKGNIIYISNVAYKYIGKEQPQKLIFRDGTTDIATNFMKDNIRLQEIQFPNTIETIGSSAFENCKNLSIIEFPNNLKSIHNKSFANCVNIDKIELPQSIEEIGDHAFENCTNVKYINLNNANCSIGIAAFRNCHTLTTAFLGNNILYINDMAFAFCENLKSINDENYIVLPEKIKTINYGTFYDCKKLNGKIKLPYNITKIRDFAFKGCRNIHSIELSTKTDSISHTAFDDAFNFTRYIGISNDHFSIHNGMLYSNNMSVLYHCPEGYENHCALHSETRKISQKAFDNCTNIKLISLNNVEIINDYAFNGCINLRRIVIGKNTKYIGQHIFEGCHNLKQIDVRKSNNYYKSEDGVLYSFDMKTLIYCPKGKNGKFKVPKTVEYIADYAFYNCNQLEIVILHKKIKNIGKNAFTGCKYEIK